MKKTKSNLNTDTTHYYYICCTFLTLLWFFVHHVPCQTYTMSFCRASQRCDKITVTRVQLNTSVFNLSRVSWTVCCLTYTTCLNCTLHSFHKNTSFYTQHLQYTTEQSQARLFRWWQMYNVRKKTIKCPFNQKAIRDPVLVICNICASCCPWGHLLCGSFWKAPLQLPVFRFCDFVGEETDPVELFPFLNHEHQFPSLSRHFL